MRMFLGKGRLRPETATHAVSFGGNSIMAGTDITAHYYADNFLLNPMFAGKGFPQNDFAIAGSSWADMIYRDGGALFTSIMASFDVNKRNFMFVQGMTNEVTYSTASIADIVRAGPTEFIRLAKLQIPNLEVVTFSSIPRRMGYNGSTVQADIDANNARLLEADQYLRDNLETIGLTKLIESRYEGSPMAFGDYTIPTFEAVNEWYAPNQNMQDRGFYTHPSEKWQNVWLSLTFQYLRRVGA